MPLTPPPGWVALQERAQQTKDPRELTAIIEQMNQLLTEQEKMAGDLRRVVAEDRVPTANKK